MSYNEFKKRKVSKVFDPDHNPSAEQIVKLLVGEDCIKCKPDPIRDKIQVYHAPCPKIKGKRLVWRKGAGWSNPLSMLQTSYGGKKSEGFVFKTIVYLYLSVIRIKAKYDTSYICIIAIYCQYIAIILQSLQYLLDRHLVIAISIG